MIQPLRDHAVIRVTHSDTVGKTGLVWYTNRKFIGSADDGYAILHAVVESVGPGKRITRGEHAGEYAGMDLVPGDKILIGRFAGLDLDIERDVDWRLIRANEALLIEQENS